VIGQAPARVLWARGLAALALLAGCTLPPVLTPVRMADRGLAPLARTAEVRIDPSVRFEQQRLPSEENAELLFEIHDIAVRPNLFAAFGFTDSFAWLIPGGVLWSPVVQPDCGQWLTLGGGVYGFGFGSDGAALSDALGIWGKRRFGAHFWGTVGIAAFHDYSSFHDPEEEPSSRHNLAVIPGVEAGVQLADPWALTLVGDHGFGLIGQRADYSRLRAELVLVPVWWIDIEVHGGIYRHERESLHVDPLVGFGVAGRW
jgi:hypothetical protein